VNAYKTPIGYIPCYEDLSRLFREVLAKEYSKEDYLKQFTLYTQRLITKIERIKNIYHGLIEIPSLLFDVLQAQRDRLDEAERQFGEVIAPDVFIKG
jgi:phosphoenolpyruvate carboxykinase (GTP)